MSSHNLLFTSARVHLFYTFSAFLAIEYGDQCAHRRAVRTYSEAVTHEEGSDHIFNSGKAA